MTTDTTETALAVRPVALSGYIPPPAKDEFEAMISMANTLAKAQGFLPAHFFGQPYKILAAILYGRDLGISATNALQHIIVIDGKATADAQLIGMLVRRAGHRLEDKTTDQSSTVTITRDDGSIHTVTFTMADAQRAGLVRAGGAWTKYPAAMLYARALTACARKGAQDALMGTIYTPEELGVEVEDGQPVAAASVVDVAEFREIPLEQASAASQEAVRKQGDASASSPGGPAPTAERETPAKAADRPAATPPREGESSPPPQASGSAGAPAAEPKRSTGPRAKRQNVVTAPQAAEKPAMAPEAIPSPTTQPVALDAEIAPPQPAEDGKLEYLDTLRQQAREVAAQVLHLRFKYTNQKNKDAIALGSVAELALPPLTPNPQSDESLAAFIKNAYAKTLAELDEAELDGSDEMPGVLRSLQGIVERLGKQGITV
ncbi:MAG TPA: hypothetical protein VMU55_05155 [Solirubrobacteraceae bacterium]|nr:hypothetical protein [Solirubrobacteraceae bacterium]